MTNKQFIRYITCICFILMNFSKVGAQISANLANLPEGEIESGSTHTIVVNVVNSGPDTMNLTYKSIIPKPIRALVFNNKLTILPNSYKNILIPLSIPKHTQAGRFELAFEIYNKGKKVAETKTSFEVPKRIEIDINLISRPQYARSDDTIRAQFMVSNTGNAAEFLNLFSRNCRIKGPNNQFIPIDSTLIIDVEMIPDRNLPRIEDKAIDLSCNILSLDRVVSDQEIIRIYPIKTQRIDPYFRFPISFNSNYIVRTTNGETTFQALQYQFSGKGSLDPKKKHNIIFDYRGPGSIRVTRVGNFSQKYIQYYNKKLEVFVGEKTYGLSNLTENFRFGTGLDVKAQVSNKIKVGAYYNRPLLLPEIKQQLAGFVEYQTAKKYTYRLNGVRNEMNKAGNIGLISLQTNWTDFTDWGLSTEISRSIGAGKHGNAYSYAGNLDFKGFKLSSTGLYADPDFKGYYANSMFLNGNLGYNLKKIGFQIGGNYNDENPNLDTVFSAAPYSILLSAGILGKPSKIWNVQVTSLYRQKIDRLSTKRFDYEEKRMRFSSTYRKGFWRTRFLSEVGYTTNLLIPNLEQQTKLGYDVQFQLSFSSKSRFSANAFSQYLSNTRFTQNRVRYILYGADISYKMHRKLILECEFQNNYLIEDLFNDRNLLNMKLNYQLAKNHHFSAYGNYGILHQSPIRRDWYYSLSYAFKVGVPLKKLLDLGSVEGQISNMGVESIYKVILLMDGQLVATDEEGRFKFNNIRPGVHQLFIDKKSIGVRDMANIKLPIEVEVFPDKVSTINFALTRSGSVKGKVELAKVRIIQSSKEKIVLPRIIIEISNESDQFLTQTDANGNFLFGSLRPGVWTVKILPTYWKDQFIIKEGEATVTVTPDGEVSVNFLIEPKLRQIKFLNNSNFKVGGK